MRLFGKITLLGYDKDKFVRDVREAAYKTVLMAAVKFIEAAAPSVPIDTGMARGSFLNLAQALRQRKMHPNVDIPTEPQRVLKTYRTIRGQSSNKLIYYHTNNKLYWKEPQSARQLSTKPTNIFKRENNVVKFTYESRVKHLNYNDGQWHSFSRGQQDFFNFLEFQKIKPLNYLLQTSQTLGGQAPSGMPKFNLRQQKTVRN